MEYKAEVKNQSEGTYPGKIRVFKFGGASVNSAGGFRSVAGILEGYGEAPVMVVVSAMGKTTNALEEILKHYMAGDPLSLIECFRKLENGHFAVISKLFRDQNHPVYGEIQSLFDQLRGYIRKGHLYDKAEKNYDFEYDQIVSFGELFSSTILFHLLNHSGKKCRLFDARNLICTDSNFREAGINWEKTSEKIQAEIIPALLGDTGIHIGLTSGFIGSDVQGHTTTLGREGSDYTAAVLAYILKSPEVVIWKDVSGVFNADPKWFKNAKKLDTLSYREAVELAYYGASVIHPKTIRPLENAGIKLYVKNFRRPYSAGTMITSIDHWKIDVPVYIRKQNQVLISVSPRDFSFIVEENLSQIFGVFSAYRMRVNLMQNSAISFSLCADRNDRNLEELIRELSGQYEIRYNTNVELYTIRHYTAQAIRRLTKGRKVLLEQKTRHTVQLVVA